MHKLHLHLILLSLFFCCFFPASSSYASVILNPNSGNNNHTRINAALSDDSKRENGILTVYLSKGTYAISDTIYLGRDTVLTGDKEAVIRLSSSFPQGKYILQNKPGSSNIIVRNFQLDGNRFENSSSSCREGFYGAMFFKDVSGVEIADMYVYRNAGDAIKIENCQNVIFHDNIVREQGGSALSISSSHSVQVYNNNILVSCGSGVKAEKSGDVHISRNILSSDKNGSFGIELGEGGQGNIEIYANKIYGLQKEGIACFYSTPPILRIHHNIIYGCKNGITVSRFSSDDSDGIVYIDFNTIDSNSAAAVNIDTGYVNVWVQNNIFSRNPGVFGEFISQGNCFADNPGASSKDYSVSDAGFSNLSTRDYHLKSKAGRWSGTSWVTDSESSPCLDKGVGLLTAESYPNGCKPNPGRYGNTAEASLSGKVPPLIMPDYPDCNSYAYFGGDEISYDGAREDQCFMPSEGLEEKEKAKCLPEDWCAFAAKTSNFLWSFVKILILFILLLMLVARLSYLFFAGQSDLIYKIRLMTKYAVLSLILSSVFLILANIIIHFKK